MVINIEGEAYFMTQLIKYLYLFSETALIWIVNYLLTLVLKGIFINSSSSITIKYAVLVAIMYALYFLISFKEIFRMRRPSSISLYTWYTLLYMMAEVNGHIPTQLMFIILLAIFFVSVYIFYKTKDSIKISDMEEEAEEIARKAKEEKAAEIAKKTMEEAAEIAKKAKEEKAAEIVKRAMEEKAKMNDIVPNPSKQPQPDHSEIATVNELPIDSSVNIVKKNHPELSSMEKSQRELDFYWKKKKSSEEIGRDYERYIGYLYEQNGFKVEYHGILYGLGDGGIDLICKKKNDIELVQCKNWSKDKVIHENHIHQLIGSVSTYKLKYNADGSKNIKTVFVTTIELSETAREIAKMHEVDIVTGLKMVHDYPCIKCNISSKGERIYHLPSDPLYDRTKISKKGECYVSTTYEAECLGFRWTNI